MSILFPVIFQYTVEQLGTESVEHRLVRDFRITRLLTIFPIKGFGILFYFSLFMGVGRIHCLFLRLKLSSY